MSERERMERMALAAKEAAGLIREEIRDEYEVTLAFLHKSDPEQSLICSQSEDLVGMVVAALEAAAASGREWKVEV